MIIGMYCKTVITLVTKGREAIYDYWYVLKDSYLIAYQEQ